MKKLLLILFCAISLEGYLGPPSAPSTTTPSTPPKKSATKPKYTKPPLLRPRNLNMPQHQPQWALAPSGPLFYHPGMVWLQNGRWMGSDNFTNISKFIALQVNFVKPESLVSPVSEETIRSKITTIFNQAAIDILPGTESGRPPLPLFVMQVMIFPVKDGFAAACFSHLFEDAPPKRLKLAEGEVFQSITWQQANLVVGPKEEFEKLLMETIDLIATNFVKRLATYQAPVSHEIERVEEETLQLDKSTFKTEALPNG